MVIKKTVQLILITLFLVFLLNGCSNNKENIAGKAFHPPAETLPVYVENLSNVQVTHNLEYVKNGHALQKLDLYVPQTNRKLPLIVFVHGGGWKEGDKEIFRYFNKYAINLTNEGYVVASVNYRLSNTSKFPAQVQDVKSAIRWLRANADKYNIDNSHIGIWGESAGGHLASLVGVSGKVKELGRFGGNRKQSSEVQAVVDWYGPTDPTKIIPLQNKPTNNYSVYYGAASQLLGNKKLKEYDKNIISAMNPITYIDQNDPPFLIMHGTIDPVVPVDQSRLFYSELKKMQVDATYIEYPNAEHSFEDEKYFLEVVKFFNDKLKSQKGGTQVFGDLPPNIRGEPIILNEKITPNKTTSEPMEEKDTNKNYMEVNYANSKDNKQTLNLHVPISSSRVPLIIYVHGGGWKKGGSWACTPRTYNFTKKGYAVACLNYRLSGQAKFPAQIQDVKAAVRWLRANAKNYNLDENKFAAWGDSAGGHLVSLLGTSEGKFDVGPNLQYSSKVQFVVDFYGPTNASKLLVNTYPQINKDYYDAAGQLLGNKPLKDYPQSKIEEINPIKYINSASINPTFLIMHGDKDGTVPVEQSREFYAALKKANVNVKYYEIKGGRHGGTPWEHKSVPIVSQFFKDIFGK